MEFAAQRSSNASKSVDTSAQQVLARKAADMAEHEGIEAAKFAYQMFMDMKRPSDLGGGGGFKPSAELCEAVMSACAARGLPRLVRRALSELNESLDESERKEVSPRLYTIAIKSCGAKSNRLQEGQKLLDQMIDYGVKPNVVTYSTLLTVCKQGAYWEEALNLIDEMHEVGYGPLLSPTSLAVAHLPNPDPQPCAHPDPHIVYSPTTLAPTKTQVGIVPNAVTYANAIHTCGRANKWEQAVALLRSMDRPSPKDTVDGYRQPIQPNVVCYTAAISAVGRAGQWEMVLTLLREMKSKGIAPNALSLSLGIRACSRAGQWERVVELFDELRELQEQIDRRSGRDGRRAGRGGVTIPNEIFGFVFEAYAELGEKEKEQDARELQIAQRIDGE